MRVLVLLIVFLFLSTAGGFGLGGSLAITLWIWYVWDLFEKVNEEIAFRQFILVIYGLNYLFSPAFSYYLKQDDLYRMKLPEDEYFLLAIPCLLLLQLGLNCIKTKIFKHDFRGVNRGSSTNHNVLIVWLYVGIFLRFFNTFVPQDLAFFLYLLGGIRFVAAFGLYMLDASKYKWHLGGLLLLELFSSLQMGMFHDFVMWAIFFGLFWCYIHKPGKAVKLILGLAVVISVYTLQITKSEYRSQIVSNNKEAGLDSFQDAVEKNVNSDNGMFATSKSTNSLTRVNQAWIFASAVNRMNQVQDYQEMTIIKQYAEAALLPRFVAPDKLKAGDKVIFNRFSGHYISRSTSMGLGFFADGYIAFGQVGTYLFAFLLGLIFSIIFKIAEGWSRISPFFILLIFPILNYAVRPDCETQTIMGHIVKGVFVFGMLMWYYAGYFSRKSNEINAEKRNVFAWKALTIKSK